MLPGGHTLNGNVLPILAPICYPRAGAQTTLSDTLRGAGGWGLRVSMGSECLEQRGTGLLPGALSCLEDLGLGAGQTDPQAGSAATWALMRSG